ncbi:hypothetical protein [Psychroserpens ponticola]|uniref:Sulfatase N-terminal domain-containing protein n=1 Tax=Psychroserpens ponticola TaxID=2932268 RepID=A0ABY7RYR4_9FLAO|nr:hypothetical protein [Psychroserpens ponticola]WCO00840.1 hypothetical protein MUN68_012275 [Psychroserpens ponticola]
MINKLRKSFYLFINSDKEFLIITIISTGLYPLLYYLNTHFYIVSSIEYLLFFVGFFMIVPSVCLLIGHVVKRQSWLPDSFKQFLFPIINCTLFALFILVNAIGFKKKILLLGLIVSVIIAIFIRKHFKKVIVVQFILAFLSFGALLSKSIGLITISYKWLEQPDDIASAVFNKNPNIYIIQPDGYASFNEISKGNYDYDNSAFNSFLIHQGFSLYGDFRSNYESTLYSNASLFAMKHHFYNAKTSQKNEVYGFGKVIVEKNPVLSIFKNNNYKTHLLLQEPYFVLGKSNLAYDYSNIQPEEVSYFSDGFDMNKSIKSDLKLLLNNNTKNNNFFFIEKIMPWHVNNNKSSSKGKDEERNLYLQRLENANVWLTDVVTLINDKDPNGLIVIVADHGGYVGFDYQLQSKTKTQDRDLLYAIFGSALAIKWPENKVPDYTNELASSVNLFRVLFSYLSDDKSYLSHLQDDSSYLIIEQETPGVFKSIDDKGTIVFEKVE